MRVVIYGIEKPPAEKRMPAEEMEKQFGEREGHFSYSSRWSQQNDLLTITFTTSLVIANGLNEAELRNVRAHERRHFEDFRRLAHQLQQSVANAVNKGADPDVDRRLEWLDYDYCVASAAFHRSANRFPICAALPPRGARPQ